MNIPRISHFSASYAYGWQPDLPDRRDLRYAIHRMALEAPKTLPAQVDLRGDALPGPYDQGRLGSCTANALAGAFAYEHARQRLGKLAPSRLFIYYEERALEHTIRSDAGAQLRDGIKVVAREGVPDERTWPYDIAQFARKPSLQAYREALKHQAVGYFRLDHLRLEEMLACLAAGFPCVSGKRA